MGQIDGYCVCHIHGMSEPVGSVDSTAAVAVITVAVIIAMLSSL